MQIANNRFSGTVQSSLSRMPEFRATNYVNVKDASEY